MTLPYHTSTGYLSRLEFDRCHLLPPVPSCFSYGSKNISLQHLAEIEHAFNKNTLLEEHFHPLFPDPSPTFEFIESRENTGLPSVLKARDFKQSKQSDNEEANILVNIPYRHELHEPVFTPTEPPSKVSCCGASRGGSPLLPREISKAHLFSLYSKLATQVPSYIDIRSTSKEKPQQGLKQTLLCNPLRIGIMIGGDTSSSGLHNVLVGLSHFFKKFCRYRSTHFIGFRNGPIGLLKNDTVLLGSPDGVPLCLFCNRGGCEILSFRSLRCLTAHEIQIHRTVEALKRHELHGLVICVQRKDLIAVAQLAESLLKNGCSTRIIAVPHGIRGELFMSKYLPITLGFDTARRTITELSGNITMDSMSSKKYYHFIRSGSSLLTLESSLLIRPTISIMAEEAHQRNMRLCDIVKETADIVCMRSTDMGKHSGCVLISDRLIESLPESKIMLDELRQALVNNVKNNELNTKTDANYRNSFQHVQQSGIIDNDIDPRPPISLSPESRRLFSQLPLPVRQFLLTSCNGASKPYFPLLHSEILIGALVNFEIRSRMPDTNMFQYRAHNFEHECYCAIPTDFDCALGYSLGHTAGALIAGGYTGVMACIRNLDTPVEDWLPCGVSLLNFLSVTAEPDECSRVCVPRRTLDIESFTYNCYQKYCRTWRLHCLFRSPGPIQFTSGRINVTHNQLPLVLRAHYMTAEDFEKLVQTPAEGIPENHITQGSPDIPLTLMQYQQAQPPTTAMHRQIQNVVVRRLEQLTDLQKARLLYKPRLPKIFYSPFTIEASDLTARLASQPVLLRATFPLTYNLRALEIVPVGLRLAQAWYLGMQNNDYINNEDDASSLPNDNDILANSVPNQNDNHSFEHLYTDALTTTNNSSLLPPLTNITDLPRSRSSISLCGFVGSSSVVRMPVANLNQLKKNDRAITSRPSPIVRSDYPLSGTKRSHLDLLPLYPKQSLGGSTSNIDIKGNALPPSCALSSRSTGARLDTMTLESSSKAGNVFDPSSVVKEQPKQNDCTVATTDVKNEKCVNVVPNNSNNNSTSLNPIMLPTIHTNDNRFFIPTLSPVYGPQRLDRLCTQGRDPMTPDPLHLPTTSTSSSMPVVSRKDLDLLVCFLGRPAPGGMNVIWGLQSYISRLESGGTVYGSLGGLHGVIKGNLLKINDEILNVYHNQGGIDLLSISEHCQRESDLEAFLTTCHAYKIRGVVLVGGNTTILTAALLTEHFLQQHSKVPVIAVPMSIDSGIPATEVTLGHDTSVQVFCSVIGSIMSEARTSKRWYFLRVSGRSLSHLCVECALETRPTLLLISEEVEQKKMRLIEITSFIADVVEGRAQRGMMYGVVLLSDSLLDHVPEVRMLFNEINAMFDITTTDHIGMDESNISALSFNSSEALPTLSFGSKISRRIPHTEDGLSLLRSYLTPWAAALFSSLPKDIQWQFAFSKDISQRVDLANVDTEVLLKTMVENELARRKSLGGFRQPGAVFSCKTHVLAYQGRSALPTTFDCDLGFSLGYTAGVLIDGGQTGYLATISNLHLPVQEWTPEAIPLTSLIDVKPVKESKALAETGGSSSSAKVPDLTLSLTVPPMRCSLDSAIYSYVQQHRLSWILSDCFCNPGPVQFSEEEAEISELEATENPMNIQIKRLHALRNNQSILNPRNPLAQLKEISKLCSEIKLICGQNTFSSCKITETAAIALNTVLAGLRAVSNSSKCYHDHDRTPPYQLHSNNELSSEYLVENCAVSPFFEISHAKSFFPHNANNPMIPPSTIYPASRPTGYVVGSQSRLKF